ncbi:hypothetical protein [Actinoallomurus rhizosphaericola]|uniref:hypothetical protein n=1 Tax=Actinoallomurus rhizosphaericola TaxID=2952536 RepID=UPI0020916ABC|nr:hypothetical protein [Actinoallomurus rhizosphaericola]MCO5993772.1 hypothetical protein [Actinoallomurus rhizosphaericola]
MSRNALAIPARTSPDGRGALRGWLAVLTDDGLAALHAAAPRHVESVRAHLIDLLSPEQVQQLGAISETLLKHLITAEPDGS